MGPREQTNGPKCWPKFTLPLTYSDLPYHWLNPMDPQREVEAKQSGQMAEALEQVEARQTGEQAGPPASGSPGLH